MVTTNAKKIFVMDNITDSFTHQYQTIRNKLKLILKDELKFIEIDERIQKLLCLWYQRDELYKAKFILNAVNYVTALPQNKANVFLYLTRKYDNLYLSSYFKVREQLYNIIDLNTLLILEDYIEFQTFVLHLTPDKFFRLKEIIQISPNLNIMFLFFNNSLINLDNNSFNKLLSKSKTLIIQYYKHDIIYEIFLDELTKLINSYI